MMNTVKCHLSKSGKTYKVNPYGVEINLDGPKGKALIEKDVEEQDIILGVRPEHINISFEKGKTSIPVKVVVNEMMGSEFHIHVTTQDNSQLIVRVPTVDLTEQERKEIIPGQEMYISFEDKVLHFFNVETEESLINSKK